MRRKRGWKKKSIRSGIFGQLNRLFCRSPGNLCDLGWNFRRQMAPVLKMSDAIDRLYEAVISRRGGDPTASKTAKLFLAGRSKMAQKLGEEAIEVVIDAARGDRPAVVAESADLIYQLVVLWAEMNIAPDDVWAEMVRREQTQGIAEKLPKQAA